MEYQSPWDCDHASRDPRLQTRANGVVCVVLQCLRCGAEVRALKKSDHDLARLAKFDTELRADFELAANHQQKAQREAAAELSGEDTVGFWAAYNSYLQSDRWLSKRTQVIQRAHGACEAELSGCFGTATQVHHTSYRHCPAKDPLSEEPIWELRAVCDSCHDKITEMDRR